LNIRRFRALRKAGVSVSAIARETGHDWKTVKKYLEDEHAALPAAPSRKGTQPPRSSRSSPWSRHGCGPISGSRLR
jgi:transposase